MTPVVLTWDFAWWVPYAALVIGYVAPKVARLLLRRSA